MSFAVRKYWYRWDFTHHHRKASQWLTVYAEINNTFSLFQMCPNWSPTDIFLWWSLCCHIRNALEAIKFIQCFTHVALFDLVRKSRPVPAAERSMTRVYSRSLAGIAGSNPAAGMDVCPLWVLSGRGHCDELITRPEESYRLWCVLACDFGTSRMRWLKLIEEDYCKKKERWL